GSPVNSPRPRPPRTPSWPWPSVQRPPRAATQQQRRMWRAPVATDTIKSSTDTGGVAAARRVLLNNGALSALVVLLVALSSLSGDFLSTQNLLNVGVQAAVVAILAFGSTFVIVAAGIDLSVGSVAALS